MKVVLEEVVDYLNEGADHKLTAGDCRYREVASAMWKKVVGRARSVGFYLDVLEHERVVARPQG